MSILLFPSLAQGLTCNKDSVNIVELINNLFCSQTIFIDFLKWSVAFSLPFSELYYKKTKNYKLRSKWDGAYGTFCKFQSPTQISVSSTQETG